MAGPATESLDPAQHPDTKHPPQPPSQCEWDNEKCDKILIDDAVDDGYKEQGRVMNLKMQLAEQRAEIDRLSMQLSQCQVEKEAVRKAFVSHVQSSQQKSRADKQRIETLQCENELLRQRVRDLEAMGREDDSLDRDSAVATDSLVSDSTVADTVKEMMGTLPRDSIHLSKEKIEKLNSPDSIPYQTLEGCLRRNVEGGAGKGNGPAEAKAAITSDEDKFATVFQTYTTQVSSEKTRTQVHSDQLLKPKTFGGGFVTKEKGFGCRPSNAAQSFAMSKMPSRCNSEGLLVDFGGNDVRKNSAANLLSKMKSHQQFSAPARKNPGDPPNAKQNSTWNFVTPPGNNSSHNSLWGLGRRSQLSMSSDPNPKAPPKPRSNSSQNSLWGLVRRSQQSTPSETDPKVPPAASSQNSAWGLIRPRSKQRVATDKNPGDAAADPSQNLTFGSPRPNQQFSAGDRPAASDGSSQNPIWDMIRSNQQPLGGKKTEAASNRGLQRTTSNQRVPSIREAPAEDPPTNLSTGASLLKGVQADPPPSTFGASGDDWGSDDEGVDERIRRLTIERSARRKSASDLTEGAEN